MSPFPPFDWQELLAEQLSPSRALLELMEDLLPRFWEMKREHGETIELPSPRALEDIEDVPRAYLKEQENAENEIKARAQDAMAKADEYVEATLGAFDAEFAQAMEKSAVLDPDHRSGVIYDWGHATNDLMKEGLSQADMGPLDKAHWVRQRGLAFWEAVIRHQDPDQLENIPAGPVKDWGMAMYALSQGAHRIPTLAGLSERHLAWLITLHAEGQHLDAPQTTWSCSSPRQVLLMENQTARNRDTRPASMRRDDHYWQFSSDEKPNAWAAWLAKVGRPPQHPATRDWVGQLASLRHPPKKNDSTETQVSGLLAGLDMATFGAWQAGDPKEQREGGATWESLETLVRDNKQESLLPAMIAMSRLHQAPLAPERNRRRYRS